MPRVPITGGTMYPNYLSNAPWALPYRGLNVSILFLYFIIMGGCLFFVFVYIFRITAATPSFCHWRSIQPESEFHILLKLAFYLN